MVSLQASVVSSVISPTGSIVKVSNQVSPVVGLGGSALGRCQTRSVTYARRQGLISCSLWRSRGDAGAASKERPSLPAAPAASSQRPAGQMEVRLLSTAVALLPLVLAFVEAELPFPIPTEVVHHDWDISEHFLKTFYMVFVCAFSWGAVVFGSMNDPFYESDTYRDAGGNGTQHWIYTRAEELEQEDREELWREELRKEIDDRLGDMKELGVGEEEKEEQLV
eukprot:TRINITY_DN205_c0_g1_i2.p1 TRINITY_DN205_c0_g1~~TRINITY_DN205_c0_g1_i2.p1  ORF type:complete len:223 (-),score=45.55 TRINITY_DN205_c0_g1_i2:405-1073(-)